MSHHITTKPISKLEKVLTVDKMTGEVLKQIKLNGEYEARAYLLKNVEIKGRNNIVNQQYSFNYYLPDLDFLKDSQNRDQWGFSQSKQFPTKQFHHNFVKDKVVYSSTYEFSRNTLSGNFHHYLTEIGRDFSERFQMDRTTNASVVFH